MINPQTDTKETIEYTGEEGVLIVENIFSKEKTKIDVLREVWENASEILQTTTHKQSEETEG